MNRVYIKTYGCQMNERDSEAVAAMLRGRGYRIVSSEDDCDILLLNTCSVRDAAAQKAIGKAGYLQKRKKKNPDFILGVLGCMAQNRGAELLDRLPDVDLLAQPSVVQPTTGTFAVRWSLALTTGGGTTCSGAGAATVDLDLQDTAGNSYHYTFTCSDYQDTSDPLPPGDYTVAVRAYDANDVLLSEWDAPITYPIYAGSVTQLPNVVLQVQ